MQNATDLLAFQLQLKPAFQREERDDYPRWWGRSGHQWLLSVVDQSDPELAHQLHEGSQLRPFTVSTLIGYRGPDSLHNQAGLRLRITAMSAALCARLLREIDENGCLAPGCQIELDRLSFEIVAVEEEQPRIDFKQLSSSLLASGKRPSRRISLEFLSPTAFKMDGKLAQVVPEAKLVFGSLMHRWNAFAPITLPEEVIRYAEECLHIDAYRLRTQWYRVSPQLTIKGAVGWIRYQAHHYDAYWLTLLHTLADFSRYSGIGAKLSIGMGQSRLRDKSRKLRE